MQKVLNRSKYYQYFSCLFAHARCQFLHSDNKINIANLGTCPTTTTKMVTTVTDTPQQLVTDMTSYLPTGTPTEPTTVTSTEISDDDTTVALTPSTGNTLNRRVAATYTLNYTKLIDFISDDGFDRSSS